MEISGTIKLINQTQTFDSGFQKREFVVTTSEQYPQDLKCDFAKDKCATLDAFNVGDSVKVGVNLRGNEFNGRYYVNLQAWKIDRLGEAATAPTSNGQVDDLPY